MHYFNNKDVQQSLLLLMQPLLTLYIFIYLCIYYLVEYSSVDEGFSSLPFLLPYPLPHLLFPKMITVARSLSFSDRINLLQFKGIMTHQL